MSRARDLTRRAGIAFRMLLAKLPDRISVWFRPTHLRFKLSEVPGPVSAPKADVRLYLAPVNFAAQGFSIARAVERHHGIGAVNMQFRTARDYGFPADYSTSDRVFAASGDWARGQRDAIGKGFTHVIVEAERALFGVAFQGFVDREVRWLQAQGVDVAMLSLGTDLRLPSRHAQIDEWSPFRSADIDRDWMASLETRALRNRRLGEDLGVPLFVATPELLLDWPRARWLPIIVDPADWRTDRAALDREVPVVLHAPTNPIVKGTALIEPTLDRLHEAGLIEYERVLRVPAAEMPAKYARADIVLDQFSLGIYATTSIEAMAAGRLVIAHLHDQVRDHIHAETGLEPPVVEATPDTLEAVLRDVLSRPEHYREIARRGPAFVDAVHDGTLSADVLAPFLATGGAFGGRR